MCKGKFSRLINGSTVYEFELLDLLISFPDGHICVQHGLLEQNQIEKQFLKLRPETSDYQSLRLSWAHNFQTSQTMIIYICWKLMRGIFVFGQFHIPTKLYDIYDNFYITSFELIFARSCSNAKIIAALNKIMRDYLSFYINIY